MARRACRRSTWPASRYTGSGLQSGQTHRATHSLCHIGPLVPPCWRGLALACAPCASSERRPRPKTASSSTSSASKRYRAAARASLGCPGASPGACQASHRDGRRGRSRIILGGVHAQEGGRLVLEQCGTVQSFSVRLSLIRFPRLSCASTNLEGDGGIQGLGRGLGERWWGLALSMLLPTKHTCQRRAACARRRVERPVAHR